jgi:hypothetical protein
MMCAILNSQQIANNLKAKNLRRWSFAYPLMEAGIPSLALPREIPKTKQHEQGGHKAKLLFLSLSLANYLFRHIFGKRHLFPANTALQVESIPRVLVISQPVYSLSELVKGVPPYQVQPPIRNGVLAKSFSVLSSVRFHRAAVKRPRRRA